MECSHQLNEILGVFSFPTTIRSTGILPVNIKPINASARWNHQTISSTRKEIPIKTIMIEKPDRFLSELPTVLLRRRDITENRLCGGIIIRERPTPNTKPHFKAWLVFLCVHSGLEEALRDVRAHGDEVVCFGIYVRKGVIEMGHLGEWKVTGCNFVAFLVMGPCFIVTDDWEVDFSEYVSCYWECVLEKSYFCFVSGPLRNREAA